MGRRNLTKEQKSYLRGKRYNLEKTGGHGQSAPQNDGQNTSKRLATEYKVAPATIERDGAFATAVDTLEAQGRQDIRDTVLRRQNRDQGTITKQQTMHTGKLVVRLALDRSTAALGGQRDWVSLLELAPASGTA